MSDVEYKMTVDQPNLPKGEPVQIPGLGTFDNGGTYEVSREQAAAYHQTLEPVYNDDREIVGSEPANGPTLLQASKSMYGVEVETAHGNNNPPPPPDEDEDEDDDDTEGDED
jgi:hypothetical protein